MEKYSEYPLCFDELTSFEKLLNAHFVARAGKRHKRDVIEFENNLFSNLVVLESQLKNNTYKVGEYNTFYIFEPKKREIQALSYRDRIVQHTICDNYLTPFYKNRLIVCNCACQVGKGTNFARQKLKQFFIDFYKKHQKNGYILKCDVKKYFSNINHDILKQQYCRLKDERVKNLIYNIIDSYHSDTKKGLPIGNQVSQISGVVFLDKLDRLIKEKLRIKYYVRYMDDLILIHESKQYLFYCLEQMKKCLTQLDLQFNEKTNVFPIKNGVEFLGARYIVSTTGKVFLKVKKQSKQRQRGNVKTLLKLYKDKIIDENYLRNTLAGFYGNTKHLSANYFYLHSTWRIKKIVNNSKKLQKKIKIL